MKKLNIIICLLLVGLLYGCNIKTTYELNVDMKANATETYTFSDTMISPVKTIVTIRTYGDIGDSMVRIEPIDKDVKSFEFYVTPGLDNDVKLEKDVWYRIGVLNKNTLDKDRQVSIQVKGVEVSIEDK